jgi:CBS domain
MAKSSCALFKGASRYLGSGRARNPSPLEAHRKRSLLQRSRLNDPTYRIGRLSTAQTVTGIAPDKPTGAAITLMLLRDYSQLPVWTNERNVRGIITWKSIASRVALGRDITTVRSCVEAHHEARSDASRFAVIPIIVETGYVLIRGPDDRIVGIVTASDLSQQFRQLAEPFLLLGEIEQHIRKMIEGQVSTLDLQSACDPSASRGEIERASDLSLGELIRLLENPDSWAKLGLRLIDRKTMIADLNRVRSIRNDVMHFDPDPVEDDAIRFLSAFSRFLQQLDDIRSQ